MSRLLHPHFQLAMTIVFITVSELFLKRGAVETAPASADWFGTASLVSSDVWIGIALLVASSLTWIATLRGLPLYLAFTLCSLIHVTIPVGSWLFLGEAIGAQRWAGISLVLAGIWLIAKPAARIEEPPMSTTVIALLVVSQIALAVSQLFLKHAMNLTEREPKPWLPVALFFSAFVALMTLWFLLWLGFLQTMPLSKVLPWEGLSPLLLVLGAAVFLREKITRTTWLGMALISAGIVLVALS